MMSISSGKVVFDNRPDAIYFAGETVSGTIDIDLPKNEQCKGFVLKVTGKARCHWEETSGTGNNKSRSTYRGEEIYLRTVNNLLTDQQPNADGLYTLKAGHYNFRFSCDLPQKLPSSYESHRAQIRYKVKLTVIKGFLMDLSYGAIFTVITPTDLNLIPQLHVPVTVEESKMFYVLLFSKGKLTLKAQMPFSGYVSGQPVQLECSLNNESSVRIKSLTIVLMQRIRLTATPTRFIKYEAYKVASCTTEGVDSKDKKSILTILQIPPVAPSTLGLCSVIDISYDLWITANTAGIHFDLTCMIPITIGTIPISKPAIINAQNISVEDKPDQPTTSSASPSAPSIDCSDLPPPTYEQAMALTEHKTKNENQNVTPDESADAFKPKYPTYDFNALKEIKN